MSEEKKLIARIEQSLKNANSLKSKINNFVKNLDGMTGQKTRHFYSAAPLTIFV